MEYNFVSDLIFSFCEDCLFVCCVDVDVLYAYQQLVATIQRDAIWWLHTIVPSFMEPKQQDYVHW